MTVTKNFNILSKQLSDTTTITLRDPATNEPMFADAAETLPLTIEVYGRSSKQYLTWLNKTVRKNAKEKELNRGKDKIKTVDESIADTAEFLAAVSIKATNFDLAGVAIDSPETFKQLYSNPSVSWIGEQVTEALSDNANFLGK